MIPAIKIYCDHLTQNFDSISSDRKILLDKITAYIKSKQKEHKDIKLVYICTHNSRRSHFGQVWAEVAACYYNIKNMHSYSGGTEATAFNTNAINALKRIGFDVKAITNQKNATYQLLFDEQEKPIVCFSKVYNHPQNPQTQFAAIMTCSDAEENCPYIPGVELRIGTTYNDPKAFDNKPEQDDRYSERCQQIALETFYIFSKL